MSFLWKVLMGALLGLCNHATVKAFFPPSTLVTRKYQHAEIAIETLLFADNNNMDSMEFDIGVCNIPGVNWQMPGKVNQDSHFAGDLSANGRKYSVFGVLDGHGKFGQEISSFASKNMPREIHNQLLNTELSEQIIEFEDRFIQKSAGFDCFEYKSTCSKTQQALINSFHAVHFNAMLDDDVKSGRNGATCIACLVDNSSLECTVAYVGDSRAIWYGYNPPLAPTNTISVIAKELTVDLPGERRRIESREGSIRGNNVFYGPVGIAMTRALGDAVMIRAGVIPTPMVGDLQLNRGDTLVLATDGIWDVLTNQQVMDIILKEQTGGGDTQDAADTIAQTARDRWIGDLPIMDEVKADDITVMVIKV